ncbi:hypothetical protein BGZ83_001416, partial [Gryganskiella cystojenkinii]
MFNISVNGLQFPIRFNQQPLMPPVPMNAIAASAIQQQLQRQHGHSQWFRHGQHSQSPPVSRHCVGMTSHRNIILAQTRFFGVAVVPEEDEEDEE